MCTIIQSNTPFVNLVHTKATEAKNIQGINFGRKSTLVVEIKIIVEGLFAINF